MNKALLCIFLISNLYSKSYQEILEVAINNNINLELIENQQASLLLNQKIDTRYSNPNLELEVANFSAEDRFGAKIALTQSILLPHIKEDKRAIAKTKIDVAKEQYLVERSDFIYSFNLKYLAYKKAQQLLKVQQKAVEISEEILTIAQSRYREGAIAKSDYLEAKLDYDKMQNRVNSLSLEATQAKNRLLKFSNIDNEEIDSSHLFFVTQKTTTHPNIRVNRAKEQVSYAKLELLKHSIDSIELFSELEKEPEQDIFRVGVSIPLPTFNTKNEEKQLEKIKLANQKLLISNQERSIRVQIKQLNDEKRELEQLKESQQSLITSQEQLFNIYKQSYTIAKVNLLKLQQIKEQQITTQEKIVETDSTIELNSIKINYLQGAYSE
jgi:cobalt-zinc-cadmium efflux system outer membrane protein